MGNAGHRHAPDCFAGVFSREREFQLPRQGDRIFKKAFKKVAQPIQQHPLGVRHFQLHVMAQYGGELLWLQLAVVSPGRLICGAGAVGFINTVGIVNTVGFASSSRSSERVIA